MAEKLSDEAREARNAYVKAWREKNPDKVKEANRKYWEKYAKRMKGGSGDA